MAQLTVGLSEAKARLSEITEAINRTGEPVTVFKKNKPWVVIYPANYKVKPQHDSIVDINEITNKDTLDAIAETELHYSDSARKGYGTLEDFFAALDKATENA